MLHAEMIGIPKDKLIRWPAAIDDVDMPNSVEGVSKIFEERGFKNFGDCMTFSVHDRLALESWRHLNWEYCIRAFASELSRLELYRHLVDNDESAIAMSDTAFFWHDYNHICEMIANLPSAMHALFFEYYPDWPDPLFMDGEAALTPVKGFDSVFSNFSQQGKYAYFSAAGICHFFYCWHQMKGSFCRSVPRFMRTEGIGTTEHFYVARPAMTYRR